MTETRYVNLEPNWANLRRWAKNALKFGENDPEPFRTILAECDKAKAAGRPNTDWED